MRTFGCVQFLIFLLPYSILVLGQTPSTPGNVPAKPATTHPMGGSATSGTYAPVFDSEKRPITAGGFVDHGPIVFEDVSKQSGIANWTHVMGTTKKKYILEMPGSGVALLDYDKDGWLDIYLVNGSTEDALRGKGASPHAALFHNNGDGTFTDVSVKAGVTNDRWGFGVTVGDYDNDGWPDIYVANFGKNRLYHNNHDGTFTDVAEQAGVALGGWSTGPSFGDYDGDGRLDLFVPGYLKFDVDHKPEPRSSNGDPFCQFRGVSVMCGPRGLPGEHDHLFHNNGDGTFTEVSEKAGVGDPGAYYGFSSVFVDINDDGKLDLLLADDSTPNYLYLNNGDGTFEDASIYSGFAFNVDGSEMASMGLAVGDYDNDGRLDLFTTTFSDDYKPLWHNDGDANFSEISHRAGLGNPTIPFLSWGTGFVDYDNDGWKDIFVANGHAYPEVDQNNWGTTYKQRPLLFHNRHGKDFELVPAVNNTGLADVIPARGAAFGDLFNDGKIDVVINCLDTHPVLLRNVDQNHNHWIELSLEGGAKGPKDAVGAKVFVTAGGLTQRADLMSSGSFESSNDPRFHFGLGESTSVSRVEIRWPDGKIERVHLPAVDRIFSIAEGEGIVPGVYDQARLKTH